MCSLWTLAHNTVYGSNITQAAILACVQKDNIFQRFVIDGERFKELSKSIYGKSRTILFTKVEQIELRNLGYRNRFCSDWIGQL